MAHVPDYTRHMAKPVSLDGFFYAGHGLYVQSEGASTHRHHRRDAASLHALLTYVPPTGPLLTKKGEVAKRQPRPYKDEPGHFYVAQLALYGLKPLKTKDAAKKNLLLAFKGGKTLEVPDRLVQLERELKVEYDQANKVAVDAHYAEKAQREKAEREALIHQRAVYSKITEDDEDDFARQIANLNVRDDASQTAAVLGLLAGITRSELALLIARLVCEDPSLMDTIEEEVEEIRSLRGAENVAPEQTRQTTNKSDQMKQTTSKSIEGKVPSRTLSAKAPGFRPKQSSKRGSWGNFIYSASYEVVAPYISEQWSCFSGGGLMLEVLSSTTGAHFWGSFNFGAVSGFFKTYGPPPPPGVGSKSFTASFRWRGHEQGEGQMTFGEKHTGTLTFLEGGKRVKGVINGSFLGTGEAKFAGTAKANVIIPQKYLKEWKWEWRSINQRASNAAERGRWGGWSDEPLPENPAASDTTAGGGRGGSDEDGDADENADEDESRDEDEDGEGYDSDDISY